MHWVLLLLIAAILHASLYPWQFRFEPPEVNPLFALVASWRPIVSRRLAVDLAVNILFYIPLGAAAYLAFSRRLRPKASAGLAVALAFALSASAEMAQLFTPARMCSSSDLVCNVLGAAIGVCIGMVLRERLKGTSAAHHHVPAGAALLLCCWAAYQLFPGYPETAKFPLLLKLDGLLYPEPFSFLAAAVAAAEWLALARLVEVYLGPKRGRWLSAALLLILPLKILMAGRTVAWPEIAGAAMGVGMGAVLRVPFAGAAGLLCAAVVARGLAPFEIAEAGRFGWIPFASLIGGNWTQAAVSLLRKTFWYGSILLLLRAGGAPPGLGAGVLVPLLAGIEAAQTRLSGHVAESTDPLLAALLAFALRQAIRPPKPT